MKVLYIDQPGILQPWYDDFVTAIDGAHEINMFDRERPPAEQFRDVGVVVEVGGKQSTHELIDLAVAAGVKLWQIKGTGLDHVDVHYFLDRGMPLANTPGQFSSVALAEHALFFMLWFAKKHTENQTNLRDGVFYVPLTEELHSATLGLIGFGNSAKELALRAGPMGMRIMAIDQVDVPPDVLDAHHVQFFGGPDKLGQVLAASDYVSIHTPLLSSTRDLIAAREFELMKPGAVLINVARGEIVNEAALIEALKKGHIAGAGIDAFETEPLPEDHPFFSLPNALLSPHNGGGSRGTSRRRGQAAADNVARVAQGLEPMFQITSVE